MDLDLADLRSSLCSLSCSSSSEQAGLIKIKTVNRIVANKRVKMANKIKKVRNKIETRKIKLSKWTIK